MPDADEGQEQRDRHHSGAKAEREGHLPLPEAPFIALTTPS
jgi:hypothetical protein